MLFTITEKTGRGLYISPSLSELVPFLLTPLTHTILQQKKGNDSFIEKIEIRKNYCIIGLKT